MPPDSLSERIAFLRRSALFADLSQASLAGLANDFHSRLYRRNEIIFHQDDTSRELYLVREGKVRIFKTSPAGGETSIVIFSAGDIFGEFAAVDDLPRSASARALGRCTLLQMGQAKFRQYLGDIPELALALNKFLAGKVRWTAAYAETIAQYDAAGRLLHILLLYNEQLGQKQPDGQRYELDLGMKQADLASLVGIRRERVSELLQQWYKDGLIDYNKRTHKIIILNLSKVQQERDRRLEAKRGGG